MSQVTGKRFDDDGRPTRVVALGGGTGLPAVLRGLRPFVRSGGIEELTAVVAMTDDGGSSGRLRRTRGLPPPGDVRNCLVALSPDEELLAGVFQHRYDGNEDVGGHSAGNLVLAALAEMTGSFMKAVELTSRVLRITGRILPVTLDDVVLEAELEDGDTIEGESRIGSSVRRIRSIRLRPPDADPTPGVVDAIMRADLVTIGPGSLYTSVLPNLLVRDVARALRETRAAVVFVANLVSERGAAAGLDLGDHIHVLQDIAGGRILGGVLVHGGPIEHETLLRYRAEGAIPLSWPERDERDLIVTRRNLLDGGPKLRHEPSATAEGLFSTWNEVRRRFGVGRAG